MRFFWKLLALVAGLAVSVLVVSSATFFLTTQGHLISRVARGDPPITFGVGMNSGSAVAGGLGSDTHLEYTVVGNAVNIAARLCSEAEAGQSTCNSPNTSRMCAGLPSGSFAKHRMQSCSRRSGTSSSVRVEGLGGSTFNVLCTISSTVRPSEGMWPDRIS